METIKKPLTKEELMAMTNIKSVAEAQKYLNSINILIAVSFVSVFILLYFLFIKSFWSIPFIIISIILRANFYYYCIKLSKRLNLPQLISNEKSVYYGYGFILQTRLGKSWPEWHIGRFYEKATFPLKVITGRADLSKSPFLIERPVEKKVLLIFFKTIKALLIALAIVIAIILIDVVIGLITGKDLIFDLLY